MVPDSLELRIAGGHTQVLEQCGGGVPQLEAGPGSARQT
jgi:hypothetical protein